MGEQRLAHLEKGKRMTRSRIYSTAAMLLLAGLACAMPALPVNETTFNTAVAQTVNAGLTQNYVSPTFTLKPTITLTSTLTPIPTTAMPTTTETVTPTFPYVPTDASSVTGIPPAQVIVSVNTNCRTGPGKVYAVEGSLLAGESAEVFGIDPTGKYWYIRNPDPGVKYCWISGKYANFIGTTGQVMVMTALPTPTGSPTSTPAINFMVAYVDIGSCGYWWPELNFTNTGQVAFKSLMIVVEDTYSAKKNTFVVDGFTDVDGCSGSTTVQTLEPGEVVTVSAPGFAFNIAGRKMNLKAVVCTDLGLKGACLTRNIWFNP
jgi:uncharacterized protein YgiM (DUF1202 family)